MTGPSGSGKSLLLRTLAGLDPIESGDVVYRGLRQGDWRMPDYRSELAYLAQRPALFAGTVHDNLLRPFSLGVHRARRFDPARALSLLQALGKNEGFLSLEAASLSGGEAQVLALTRVLLLAPRVLLLDEATASLDFPATRLAENVIARWLGEEASRACVWVSHDRAQLSRVAAREVALHAPPEGDLA